MPRIYTTTLSVLGCDVEAKIIYEYHPQSFGKREMGIPIEPDESSFIEINQLAIKTVRGWIEVDFDEETETTLTDEIMSRINP